MQDICEAWEAADKGDWRTYMRLHRDGLRIKPLWEERPSSTYQGEFNKRVRGIIFNGVNGEIRLTTREGEWVIQEKNSAKRDRLSSPWTCVNNSTHTATKGLEGIELPVFDYAKDDGGLNLEEGDVKRHEPPRTDTQLAYRSKVE